MRQIAIEQSTFERLQQHARPLVDTPDSVIVRALDALDRSGPTEEQSVETRPTLPPALKVDVPIMTFGPNGPLPDVMHTRMLAASIDGQSVKSNWNNVLRLMLMRAKEHYGDFEELRRRCAVNIVPQEKGDDGYRHLPQAGLSYQGVNANAAANAIVALAKDIGTSLDVDFEWRNKEQAAHPGRRGRIQVPARRQSARTP